MAEQTPKKTTEESSSPDRLMRVQKWRAGMAETRASVKEVVAWLALLVGAFVVLLVAVIGLREVGRDSLLIEPISVPSTYESSGWTSTVMGSRVGQEIRRIEQAIQNNPGPPKDSNLYYSWSEFLPDPGWRETITFSRDEAIPEIDVPGTMLNLRAIIELVREGFGREPTRVQGDVVLPVANADSADPGNAEIALQMVNHQGSVALQPAQVKWDDPAGVAQAGAQSVLFERRPFQLIWYLIEEGQLDQAAQALTALANSLDEKSQERHTALSMLGAIEGDLKNYNQAADAYSELMSLEPNDALAQYNLAWVYEHQDRGAEAKQLMASALKLDPQLAQISPAASSANRPPAGGGSSSAGTAAAAPASKWIDRDAATVAANRSKALRDEGHLNQAEAYVNTALKLDKTNIRALSEDTKLQLEKGRTQAALERSKQLVAADPNNPMAHYTRYQVLNSAGAPGGERQDADQELREALRLNRQVRPVDRLQHQVRDLQLTDVPNTAAPDRPTLAPRSVAPGRGK